MVIVKQTVTESFFSLKRLVKKWLLPVLKGMKNKAEISKTPLVNDLTKNNSIL